MTRKIRISELVAQKLSQKLCKKLGTPEGNSGCYMGKWLTQSTWRYRRDDGSNWARLGYGPTSKMVTLSTAEYEGKTDYYLIVETFA